ncbi:hypothetical protein NE236_24355 [Actinoallomurus purpureus]|uniref:hypothetical protein n=1 Tax=Actinoallomurus purpureus TaxID=478114 RepID=UPI002093BDFA|nr:hypothetical protein [Actinoallomurus purpureus]MCO6008117.1 hypothetical protein [Actinoallomurus purpureus]
MGKRHTTYGATEQIVDALAPRVRFVADGDEVFPGVGAARPHGRTGVQEYVEHEADWRVYYVAG